MRPEDPIHPLPQGPVRPPRRPCPRGLFSGVVLVALASALQAQTPPSGPVVINEVFYHPPDTQPSVQWIEVFNRGDSAVDLSGWAFGKGVEFAFPAGTRLERGAYAVVVADLPAFQRAYGTNLPVAGAFRGHLSGKGERVELRDANGRVADWVHYHDRAPWPAAADGSGASLERIDAASRSDIPANWAPSARGRGERPAGTPGKANGNARTNLPPIPSELRFDPLPKGRPNRVSVRWNDPDTVVAARVEYRVGTPQGWGERRSLPMARVSGDTAAGEYSVELPVAPEGSVVRFRLVAKDGVGGERTWPSPQDLAPEFSYLAMARVQPGTVGQLQLWTQGHAEAPGPSLHNWRPPQKKGETPAVAGDLTAVYVPPAGGGDPELHDFVRIAERSGGWKVKTGKGAPLMGMHSLNLVFENSPRWVLAEHLAYELFRRSRVPAPDSGHVRVVVDGQDLGYHLYVEQPDNAFLARRGRDPAGNLYKLVWFENGLVRQHEKKNNPLGRHEDLKAVMNGLNSRRGDDQWAFIRQEFDVDEVVDYYVVGQCIQNWDGYFNNHYVYRAPGAGGRWQVFPWDEDKTWGDFDGASSRYDWYSMPITYGMNGDRPPPDAARFNGGPFGGMSWWRPGGWFSAPLLANPGFRDRYRSRLREFCTTEFTPEKFGPVVDALEKRLEGEVRHRAEVRGARVEPMLAKFHADIDSFRRQLVHRREFILKALEK